MLPARPTSSWLESNNNSLHQTQGSSEILHARLRKGSSQRCWRRD